MFKLKKTITTVRCV